MPERLLAEMKQSRALMKEMIQTAEAATFEEVQRVFLKGYDSAFCVCRSIAIERAIAEQGQSMINGALHKYVLAALPAEDVVHTPAQVAATISDLRTLKVYQLADTKTKFDADCVHRILTKMEHNVAPDVSLRSASKFFADVFQRLPFFIRLHLGEMEAPKDMVAKEALDFMLPFINT